MMYIINNKKAKMEMSVLLLVLTTLILVIFSLYIFNTRSGDFRKEITTPSSIEEIYSASRVFEFNVRHIAEQLIKADKINSESYFVNKFKSEFNGQFLANEKIYSPYEYGLYTKFNTMMAAPKNYEVKIKDNLLTFNMKDFNFSDKITDSDARIISIRYVKNITFQIPLK